MKLTRLIFISSLSSFVWAETNSVPKNDTFSLNVTHDSPGSAKKGNDLPSLTENPNSVAFFVKIKNKYKPVSIQGEKIAKEYVQYLYYDESNTIPRNFSIKGNHIFSNEVSLGNMPVGYSKGRLVFGGNSPAVTFNLNSNGEVISDRFKMCNLSSTHFAIFHANAGRKRHCSQVELYVLPSYQMSYLGPGSVGFTATVNQKVLGTYNNNYTYIWYIHGDCELISRADEFEQTFLQLRNTNVSGCMNFLEAFGNLNTAELQERNCTLGISGPNATEYSNHFLKGYNDECKIFINGKEIVRVSNKPWTNFLS